MGKTLQSITTILDNRPKLQHSLPGAKHPPSCSAELKEVLVSEETLWDNSLKEWSHEMKMNNVPQFILPKKKKIGERGGARAGTLVICPMIALTQWKVSRNLTLHSIIIKHSVDLISIIQNCQNCKKKSEIDKFCEADALSVCVYHGPDRVKTVSREMMRKYDVILTTYQVLEQDFRKMVSPNKVKCPNCGNKFKVSILHRRLIFLCG